MSIFFHELQSGINTRQRELQIVTDLLAKEAQKIATHASIIKVCLILLGAFVAIREVASQILGTSSPTIVIIFTVTGLLISVLAGLEAAFKWEGKSIELRTLAALCQATLRQVDSQWYKEVGNISEERLKEDAAQKLLELQDTKLAEIQAKASALGVNITITVRDLLRKDDYEGGPYLA